MNAKGMACIRVHSVLNDWCDCMIFTPVKFKETATLAIVKGVDLFLCEDNQKPYGDCIASSLSEKDIPYVIEYCKYDEYTCEPFQSWLDHVEDSACCEDLDFFELTI